MEFNDNGYDRFARREGSPFFEIRHSAGGITLEGGSILFEGLERSAWARSVDSKLFQSGLDCATPASRGVEDGRCIIQVSVRVP
jgi:hypothetical protein